MCNWNESGWSIIHISNITAFYMITVVKIARDKKKHMRNFIQSNAKRKMPIENGAIVRGKYNFIIRHFPLPLSPCSRRSFIHYTHHSLISICSRNRPDRITQAVLVLVLLLLPMLVARRIRTTLIIWVENFLDSIISYIDMNIIYSCMSQRSNKSFKPYGCNFHNEK